MDIFFSFLICALATTAGAISGIGGGVIIKPVMDAASGLSAATLSFLSGCTVLSMTVVSLLRGGKEVKIEKRRSTLLAVGAAAGGVLGKQLFDLARIAFGNDRSVGIVQNIIMVVLTGGVLIYVLNREKIRTLNVSHAPSCVLIGLFMGLTGAFLGIGGGPINLVILYYFFSMDTKTAALNSIYIILFSQAASLFSAALTGAIPSFKPLMLAVMIVGGVAGGFLGRHFSRKMSVPQVDRLFRVILICITAISCYNIYTYAA